ncbi:MAG: hypothetical protein ACREEV_04950, partial [Dongiaceae bacterium]
LRLVMAVAVALALFGSAATAENRSDLAPYRFRAPTQDLNAVERDRAISYRNQLQRQQFQLDRDAASGRLDPLDRRLKLDNQTELNRMNEVVRGQQPAPRGLPGTRSLPSMPPPLIPRSSP